MNDAYPLKPFRVTDLDTLCRIVRRYPLGTVISGEAGRCALTLVPMLVDRGPDGGVFLSGHIDRNNDQAASLSRGAPVSFHFAGPDSYASPDLYADAQLPGWLYVSVQGDGEVVETIGAEGLRKLLVRSTEEFGGTAQRFRLTDDDPRMLKLLPYVHGFRIRVTRMSGIAKLAQDKGRAHSDTALRFLSELGNAGSLELFEELSASAGS